MTDLFKMPDPLPQGIPEWSAKISKEDERIEDEILEHTAHIEYTDCQAENDPLVIAQCLPWKEKRDALSAIYADELERSCLEQGFRAR